MKRISVLLVLSAVLFISPACTTRNSILPTEAPEDVAIATSTALSFEANDSVMATSVATTVEANDSFVATSVVSTLDLNKIIATSVASTVEASREVLPQITDTPTSLPIITPSVATPTASLTPTATASFVPKVSVSVGTNCRTGPGKIYAYIGELKVGESAEVVGKKTSYNYWIIKNPDASGTCWLWGEYATVIGDTSNLQEYAIPFLPTPTSTTLSVPKVSVSVGTNCRTGPGKIYAYIGELKVGESAEVVGKKTSYNYWIIKNPDASGTCWLWGEYATVIGDTSSLQEYAIPFLPTPTSTTLSVPKVRVSVGTNCRTGPGKIYAYIGELKVGESAEVVGKKTSYNYWIIKNPDASGTCWLWGEYATVIGDISNLQEYSIPPLP